MAYFDCHKQVVSTLVLYVTIPNDSNIWKKELEKLEKNIGLKKELERM